MINLKKATVGGRVVTVYKPTDILKNSYMQNKFSAAEINNFVLPVKNSYDPTSPGFYIMSDGKIGRPIYPSKEDADEYSAKNIVDFNDVKTIKDVIAKNEEIKRMESEVLSNSDNLFKPIPKENDSPEMRAMKEAICLKNIDLDAYADRFSDNYANDKRLLKGSNITISKMKSICDKLDLKVTLTITDSNPNVPNPMNQSVSVDICGYNDNDE